jgi:hypothetical protein
MSVLSDFIAHSFCYLTLVGIFQVVVFLVGCIVAAILPPWTVRDYSSRVQKLGLFLAILLVVGDLFGFCWLETIRGHFYNSTDYCGTDFLPFFPITQGEIDSPFANEPHGLLGITLTQLHLIWLAFAVGTWGTTVAVHRKILRRSLYPVKATIAAAEMK